MVSTDTLIVCDRCGEIVRQIDEGEKFVCTCGSTAAWLFESMDEALRHSRLIRDRVAAKASE